MRGKWILRYTRLMHRGPQEETHELSAKDVVAARTEAKARWAVLREASTRQFNPVDPVSDPRVVYEERLT